MRPVFKKVPQKGVVGEVGVCVRLVNHNRTESDRTRLGPGRLVRSALVTLGLFAVISILLRYNLFLLSLLEALGMA